MKIRSLAKKLLLGILGVGILSVTFTSEVILAAPSKGFGDTLYVENIGVPGTQNAENTGASLLDSIKKFINWALGMLASVALVICLYAGVKMMTAGGDDGQYKSGFDMIKKAAIGLVIIGCSWLIVSFIMWIIGNVT